MKLVRVIVASENRGKAKEIEEIFSALFPGIEVRTPAEIGVKVAYPDEGAEYETNAVEKARAACEATGLPSIADDSGIEVETLGGAPGPLSARYAPTDEERNAKLLAALEGCRAPNERRARFVCAAAIVLPDGTAFTANGEWRGTIARAPSGLNGFGFDPIFIDEVSGRTAAELSSEEKASRSHRGKALRALAARIRNAPE